jgi:hypothetical protein
MTTWKSAEPSQLVFGPLAMTRAMCPPGSLHDRIVKVMGYVRTYVMKDGHLFLSLRADGGNYEFEPLPKAVAPAPPRSGAPAKADGPSFDCGRAAGTVSTRAASKSARMGASVSRASWSAGNFRPVPLSESWLSRSTRP